MRTFLVIWLGRVIGVVGAKASAFALSLWVYQQTGSITQFSLSLFVSFVPGLLLSPVAGVLIDRHSRRTILAGADTAVLAAGVALLAAQATGHLAVWQIYAVVAVQSACATFQWPALSAAVTDLVAPDQRSRAAAMTQTGLSVAQLLGPTLSTALMHTGGLSAVLVADTTTALVGLLTLAVIRIPGTATRGPRARPGYRAELRVGRRLIGADRRLTYLLRLTAVLFACQSAAPVIMLPLIVAGIPIERQSLAVAAVSTAAGLGLAAASLAMAVLPQPRMPLVWARTATVVSAVAALAAGLVPGGTAVLTAAAFVFSAGVPVVVSSSQSVWQEATEPGAQGRVFALRRMVVQAATMAGLPLAGLLMAYVGTPLVTHLAGPLRSVFPTGSGLLLCCVGVTLLTVSLPKPHPRPVLADDPFGVAA
ncbi:MFS transporter [Micromonospora sp. DT201]|uniref:MFS transporter n=1 Tax=Micromonospora sp. DT201 TaxID=3393442 RepID=UPI003CE7E199